MKYHIIPLIDCVFKALLGAEGNKNLLIHFVNAVLNPEPSRRISAVEILNPFNEKEFLSDKLSIVDVKARDEAGRTYQIEVQLSVFPALPARMLYTWSDLYAAQLKSGEDYQQLQPVVSIWLLSGILFPESPAFHHHFQMLDRELGVRLNEHASIHVLELNKWHKSKAENELDRWTYFFREAQELDDEHLPAFMNTQEMRQAMETLKLFSEKEREYHLYQSRMDYLRWQRTIERSLEMAQQEARQAQQKAREAQESLQSAVQSAVEEKEAALQSALREKEQLLEILRKSGVDLDSFKK
ncbi:MAG: Rpn family recombination-promoting nuclease/putative transposase [SAR324 cluster bacterium]|nr:Rpn family recombination-promoting nuclease/putative transposase [SAR324 cluster bacterium]